MKILSLFDGISIAQQAFRNCGIKVDEYYASEIDKYAIQIAQKNFPDTIQVGSVVDLKGEVLHLSGVYDRIKLYDCDIQNKLSEQEMLYWLNEDFSISAKIGTQIKNADTSESTALQCVEEIWFSKRGMGDIIKTRNFDRSRGNGKENDTTIQVPILQCGDWWYVYRSDTRDKEENIYRTIGEKIEKVIYRENQTVSIETVQHTGSKGQIIKADKGGNVETRDTKEILTGDKKPQEWRIEAIRNREEEARSRIQDISSQLSRWNDNERITEENWNLLQLHQEMETTLVTSSQSINISLGRLDLLCGGSPCQDLSIAKKNREGLSGSRSGLFWEYVRILKEVKPKYFILENVNSMPKEAKQVITETLGVEPIMINAALVSAQNRKRLFWVGQLEYCDPFFTSYKQIEIPQPKDREILLRDILEPKVDDSFVVKNKSNTIRTSGRGSGVNDKHNWDTIRIGDIGTNAQAHRVYSIKGKSVSLGANGGGQGAKTGLYACAFRGRNFIDGKRKDIKGAKTEQRLEIGGNKANTITSVQKDSLICMIQKTRGFNKGGVKSLNGKTPTLSSHSWEQNNKLVIQPVKDKLFAVRSIYNKTLNFDKSNTLGSNSQYQTAKTGQGLVDFEKQTIRRLTPIECERLQGLPDNYTDGISNTQRYKALGNAFNVDVVAHILSFIKELK